MNHDLKIATPYLEALLDGRKTFEIRENDRGFQAGDTVTFRENTLNGVPRRAGALITYVTNYMQQPNHVVFSVADVEGI